MKYTILFLLCVFGSKVYAQALHGIYKPNSRLADTTLLGILQEAKTYVPDAYQSQISCSLQAETKSNYLKHVNFSLWFQEAYCWGAAIKLSVDKQHRVYAIQVNQPDWQAVSSQWLEEKIRWERFDTNALLGNLMKYHPIQKVYRTLHPEHGFCFAVDCWSKQSDYTLLFDAQQNLRDSISHQRYFGRDTFVHARVFTPDPLSVQGLIYGGIYKDNADNDDPWLAPAYRIKKVPARFIPQTGQFLLQNHWVSIEEFEAPVVPPAQQSSQTFFFNRNESGFEDVMAMYHIMNLREKLTDLGYPNLMNQLVHVDAHAQFGADNSVFVRNGGDPALRFGTGGVDDAEDADVIIHEYAHGLSWSANLNNNFTFERSALDEGLADYIATSYSRRKENYRWQDVFTWDGHNEFWQGRTAQSTRQYPSNGNIYQIGEIWNAVLSKLWSDIGADVTDRLQLESMYFYTEQTTLPEAARFLIEADTLLYGGIHSPIICQRFQQQGVLNSNCLPTALTELTQETKSPQVNNSWGFAMNEQSLLVHNTDAGQLHYTWYNGSGMKIAEGTLLGATTYSLDAPACLSGFCILVLSNSTGTYRFPLVRYK